MKRRVLLVNLNKNAFETQRSFLGRDGIDVISADSLADADLIRKSHRVDVIVADLGAPGSFPELSADFRAEKIGDVPVILLCGGDPEEKAWACSFGANALIEKPYSAKMLHDHVAEFLAIPTRLHQRVYVTVEVHVMAGVMTFLCTSQNLSISGMLIETDKELRVGDELTCSFLLSERLRIITAGEVVRTIETAGDLRRYGIRFINLDEEQCLGLESYIHNSFGSA